MPIITRRNVLTLLPLTAMGLGLAACADNPKNAKGGASGSGKAQEITVTLTDDSCQLSSTSFPSGVVTFIITNSGSVPNELEILTEDKLQIISEQENIGPGTTTKLTTSLKEGTCYAACKPNMVGELKGITQLTITKGAAVDVSADEAKAREAAVTNYTAYVRDQAGQLLTATQNFVTAYTSGDTATAQSLYPLARQYYERIEPTAESFGIKEAGDLDASLDTRVQDLASGAGKAVTDKEVIDGWTGWHRIEADLWVQDPASPFKFTDDAARQKVADQLNADTKSLYDLVYGNINGTGGKKFELELEDVANGAATLLEEVATTKIVGEEETFSHTDLYDFQANVEGAKVAYGNVEDLMKKKDSKLAEKITTQFKTVEDLVAAQANGQTADGQKTYVDYSTIASVQKDAGETPDKNSYTDVQRKFSDAVNALSESLSQVAGTIL